ncbi:MAG: pterin-4-alpha-carbinolamine dehydratase [Candidatus Woesebacteria bacterium GW2011_GWB1_38_5b]|uniref:4a-hydroxytetrahydrobiopterin dehydratase n=1 Tax=Candidatus Woesebacteria bacterium GW2011_GWB1_38_5b TaxID=1618569 RepID=A0A0G0NEG1_9BACT|nr:MAG: pterin-4-alpha-carbinolamine dehydratase [Candidatus Woesebacteria bacterium GW2011_GWB1_38_5b]
MLPDIARNCKMLYLLMDLNSLKCVPCQVGAPTLKGEELQKYLTSVSGWELYDSHSKIRKEFTFENFMKAIEFINKIAQIAEAEGHHPNIYLYNYKQVRVELWTHKINGLHQNDFILASKIDEL